MPIHIALLRAINVGGRNKITMPELRHLCEDLGLSGVQSLLQSGNLVFRSDRRSDAELERLLETETAKRLGVSSDFLVRSAADWNTIIAHNPFSKEAKSDPSHLLVVFLKAVAPTENVKALRVAIRGPEMVRSYGKQLYAVYPAGIGRSKLTLPLIEKTLATRGTARNWNTLLKLASLCQ